MKVALATEELTFVNYNSNPAEFCEVDGQRREPEPYLVPIPVACRLLSVGRTTAYGEIAAGRLERVKIGSRSFITMRSIRQRAGEAA